MRVLLKVYVNDRVKNRIKIIADEKGLSMSDVANAFIEEGLYRMFEEEKEYGEIKFSEINSKWHS